MQKLVTANTCWSLWRTAVELSMMFSHCVQFPQNTQLMLISYEFLISDSDFYFTNIIALFLNSVHNNTILLCVFSIRMHFI